MCGIYGQWELAGAEIHRERASIATSTLRHRGPDDEGYLLAEVSSGRCHPVGGPETSAELALPRLEALRGVAPDLVLGFRRLAILDLSVAGHQPMGTPDGRFWIVFNGEVYNYRELRAELLRLGHTFRSDTDSEVVLAAYRAWGADCLHRFNGMWAFAIWDANRRELFLARDRFGVKPLFYTRVGSRFVFASEIKALVGPHGIPFRPRPNAVFEYLTAARMPDEREGETFMDGVRCVPPGHLMRVTRESITLSRYYALPDTIERAPAPPAEVAAEFRDLLTDAVRVRLRSDVPVGSCLSGGLDSSAIVCLVDRLLTTAEHDAAAVGARQRTFSAVYEEEARYNERRFVEIVLRATGAEGVFTTPTAERFREELPRLVRQQDEPFNSTSIFAQWCVMSAVREHGVTVLLDGQGADESLGGYQPFDIVVSELLRRGRLGVALRAGRDMRATAGVAMGSLFARALARQLPGRYTARFRRRAATQGLSLLRPALAALAHDAAQDVPYREFRGYAEGLIRRESLPALLRYEDRNSMAFSVEGRVPFLDYRLVEYALTAGAPWVLHRGWTKWVLRAAVEDVVPPAIVWRRDKVGFETPERRWMTHLLDRDGAALFADGAPSSQYLDLAAVRADATRWRADAGDTRRLWRCINLELWLRAFT